MKKTVHYWRRISTEKVWMALNESLDTPGLDEPKSDAHTGIIQAYSLVLLQ